MKKVSAVCMVALFLALGTMALAHRAGKDGGDETPIYVAPSKIVVSAPCPCVTIHTEISEGSVTDVSVAVNGKTVPVWYTFADSIGNLVVKLKFDEVVGALAPVDETATFEVEITTKTGVEHGEETVPVKS